MNETDPIVDEVRRIRDAHAAKFNYDPEAIFQDIKDLEKRSGRTYVSFADDGDAPNQPPQPAFVIPGTGNFASLPKLAEEIRAEFDFDAVKAQREYDLLHADDHLP